MTEQEQPKIEELDAKTEQLAKVTDYFNSDITQVSGRDSNDKILWIHIYAKGDEAKRLYRYMKRRDRADAKKGGA